MISACLDVVHCSRSEPEVFHFAFRILYLMTKTRGYKAIIRLMPHTVDDIEPTLSLLMEQDINDSKVLFVCFQYVNPSLELGDALCSYPLVINLGNDPIQLGKS